MNASVVVAREATARLHIEIKFSRQNRRAQLFRYLMSWPYVSSFRAGIANRILYHLQQDPWRLKASTRQITHGMVSRMKISAVVSHRALPHNRVLARGMASMAFAATAICCGGGAGKARPQQSGEGLPVRVQVARSEPVNDTTEYVATLKSRDSAVIMPEVEGRIT